MDLFQNGGQSSIQQSETHYRQEKVPAKNQGRAAAYGGACRFAPGGEGAQDVADMLSEYLCNGPEAFEDRLKDSD